MAPALIVLAVLIVSIPVVVLNGMVRSRNLVRNSWGLVDTELQRRHDLVPNLVACVRGYATHESEILEAVTAQRADALASPPTAEGRGAGEQALVGGMQRLLAVAEGYPDLKADTSFRDLQRQLVDIEDRIAVARRVYNANVRDFNTRIQSFPGMLFAQGGRFTAAEPFEVSESVRDAGPPLV